MARPLTPLISKRSAVQAALDLIDEQGIEQFSLRRLGAKLGVHGMSFYHYFRDKDDLLDEVASLVLGAIKASPAPADNIAGWALANAKGYRRALLQHPNAMPLFIHRLPAKNRAAMYVHEFEALARLGISPEYWVLLLETIEAFVLGAAMFLRRNTVRSLGEGDGLSVGEVGGADDSAYDDAFDLAFKEFIGALYAAYRRKSAKSSE